MIPRQVIWALTIVGAAVYVVFLLWELDGQELTTQTLLSPLPRVVAVVVFAWFLFERFVWRIPLLHPWLVPVPDLNGTWGGTLKSNFAGSHAQIEAFLVVRQTLTTLRASLFTSSSVSTIISGRIVPTPEGSQLLVSVYSASARLLEQPTNRAHRGAMVLSAHTSPARSLSGDYWTDRGTAGELEFKSHSPRQAQHFEDAKALLPTS